MTNWKYKRLNEWSCPRHGAKYVNGPEIAADIGVYEKGKLLTTITVMGVNYMTDEGLKQHIRGRALQEIANAAKREEQKEAEKIPVTPDEIVDSFDLAAIREGHPV